METQMAGLSRNRFHFSGKRPSTSHRATRMIWEALATYFDSGRLPSITSMTSRYAFLKESQG